MNKDQDGELDFPIDDSVFDTPISPALIREFKKLEKTFLARRDSYEGGARYAVWGGWHRLARAAYEVANECSAHNKMVEERKKNFNQIVKEK